MLDQCSLVLDRQLPRLVGLGVDPQGVLKVTEDAHVIDNEASGLARCHAVRSGDGLHQGVIAHRLVEVERGAGRHVEAGDPHRADEDQSERPIGILELLVKVLAHHALAVRDDVQSLFLQVFNLVLGLRHHHSHEPRP